MSFYLCLLAGFLSGFFGGMGMGGGTVLIPLLTLLFSVPQLSAQQINLLSFLPMALFSLPVHFQNGFIRKDSILPLLPSALVCSIVFSLLVSKVEGDALKKGFGVFLCLLSLYQLVVSVKLFTKRKKDAKIKKV